MRTKRQHKVARSEKRGRGERIILLLLFSLATHYISLTPTQAEINNTLAYSVSHTSSTSANDLNVIGTKTVAQTIFVTTSETWYGIVVYLDRQGLGSSEDSVRLRFRGNSADVCETPDTSLAPKRDVYVKILDIPDGDATRNTLPPDSVARGYAIWFIFDSPVNVSSEQCYTIFLNAPRTDASNRINFLYGTNGYASGSCYYATTSEASWTDYSSDMDFRVIKDKYALIAVRRLPFNTNGAITINGDVDGSSQVYLDSLHRWFNTDQSVGGSYGTGLNGQISTSFWFGRDAVYGDSLGTFSSPLPFYFHDNDTLSAYYKDSVDNYIDRRWYDFQHCYVDCGWDGAATDCADSTHVIKYLDYMLARSSFDKIYKGGIWVGHGSQLINFGDPGETAALGDSSGTVYHHSHRTLATGRTKFIHMGDLLDPGTSSTQRLDYTNFQSLVDSLNFNALPFSNKTLRDNTKTYLYKRVGRANAAVPDSVYKFFNLGVAKQCSDSNWISVVYCHLGKNSGMTATSIDSIRAVHESASGWGLWIPSTKALFNQQAASAFSQVTVDRPDGSKRRVNIKSLYDWSWGSRVPDIEELRYLTFIAYAPESLIVTINASETLACSTMTAQQDVATSYNDIGASSKALKAMSWVGMYDRTAGRLVVISGEAEEGEPPAGQRRRLPVIEQLLSRR
ncbi:MAG: hypothetical protein OEV55_06315 [candidate division Zixibacteria bacterium]|nr:hypothetical protein [candidate division Zixibacteria bacterium]